MNSVIRLVLVVVAVAALAFPVAAQQADHQTAPNPLVQLLQSKGILTAEEAATVRTASTTGEANERLAHLLLSKGLISQEEYNTTVAASAVSAAETGTSGAHLVNAAVNASPTPAIAAPSPVRAPKLAAWPVSPAMVGYDASDGTAADASVIPAIAPVRVLPIGIPKDPKGIIPDIKLGSGALLNVYGFFKASAQYTSTNSGGAVFGNNDFPLPLFLGADTGPDKGSQFRIKARSTRAGVNFAWPINGPNLTLTAKMEFDWEGDYTTVNNRNVSSIRNSQLSIRLYWARLDGKFGTVPWFAEFGQDWTLIGSSTMMDIFETTQLGAFFGNPYERIPQIKGGLQFTAGRFKIEPEVAVTLGAFADANLNNSTSLSLFGATGPLGVIPTGFQNQTRFAAELGPDSTSPGIEGRIVLDFPLNKGWKGVPNAELIVSGGHAEAEEILPAGSIPNSRIGTAGSLANTVANALITPSGPCQAFGGAAVSATNPASIRCYFPTGLALRIPQNVYSVEAQLPTPWVTLTAKYYRGADLRFLFAGQTQSAFADLSVGTTLTPPSASVLCDFGTPGCAGGSAAGPGGVPAAVPGRATIGQNIFANSGDTITFRNACAPGSSPCAPTGIAVAAPLRPIRSQGGFLGLAFPLSRIFGANPEGLNNGWRLFVAYGVDSTFNRDVTTTVHCAIGSPGCSAAGTIPRAGGNGLLRSDYVPVSLRYRINKWAEIVNEVTWYDTRLGTNAGPPTPETTCAGACLTSLVRGTRARVSHAWTNEFGTIFTF